MKKFLFSIICLLSSFFLIDRGGGMLMRHVFERTQDNTVWKIRELVNGQVHADVVMMGTSRCESHYASSVIADTLRQSVYNTGISSSDNIISHYMALRHLLTDHHPKMICLEVCEKDFDMDPDAFIQTSYYAPFMGAHPSVDSLFCEFGSLWRYRVSHLYRYNSRAVAAIAGLFVNRVEGASNGYIPLQANDIPLEKTIQTASSAGTDARKGEYMQRFIALCKQEHIQLVFVISPRYTVIDSSFYSTLRTIASRNGIPFLDYHTGGLYLDHPEYFRDKDHLWDKGAKLYSSVFASDLKRILQN